MHAKGEVLFPPAIQYNPPQERVEPDQRGCRVFSKRIILF